MAQDTTGLQAEMRAMEERLASSIGALRDETRTSQATLLDAVEQVDRKVTYLVDHFLAPGEAAGLKRAGGRG